MNQYSVVRTKEDDEMSDSKGDVAIALDTGVVGLRHPNLRNAFLRRVYGILSLQLAVTVGVAALCVMYEPVRLFSVQNARAVIWGSFIPSVIVLIALSYQKANYPLNIFLLGLFTLAESWLIGVVCAIYHEAGLSSIVLQAAGITLAVFLCLTAYALVSRRDFSFLGGFLFAGLLGLLAVGFFSMLFGFQLSWLYSFFGALLFCGFILYDTWKASERYGCDDYVIAAVELYLDIVNLFLYILSLLRGGDQ
eukprot:TRINITY_DN7764_c0_g1_i3.p1 TRINITY_DN7764_c0_g1~~TRINITY_DN7764_c0_g1_i3.p1  ORF type:complete len:264 (-),score=85.83 TRINITY_DN7764_c0_g1_i3:70-819(-)